MNPMPKPSAEPYFSSVRRTLYASRADIETAQCCRCGSRQVILDIWVKLKRPGLLKIDLCAAFLDAELKPALPPLVMVIVRAGQCSPKRFFGSGQQKPLSSATNSSGPQWCRENQPFLQHGVKILGTRALEYCESITRCLAADNDRRAL